MKLEVLLPTRILLEEEVGKVTAEGENGSFTLLPRHIDFVASLPPGLLSYEDESGDEHFLAVDEGVLLKMGPRVLVSVRDAVGGRELGELRETVEDRFMKLDEKEKTTRTTLAKLEGSFVRRFLEYQKHG